ncbi:coiled-coil domain-containing protein 106-like [Carassius auratus]|uniref:Coiled-coil domain-containing protein 106-like n=1 Tax=Carassius auratus TaxID=7957 RepID=A0A6P6L693_CARAU|nr:coiled-coil domain-containing protein 106-like [Carassius auratus]
MSPVMNLQTPQNLQIHQNLNQEQRGRKRIKSEKNKKKSKKLKFDFRRVRTPEDSIKRYHKVLQLVNGGLSKAEAYNKMNVDRNTIVMQAPIAELAIANPEEYKAMRATFKKGESIQKFAGSCLARCLAQPNVDMIKKLKESSAILDISKK